MPGNKIGGMKARKINLERDPDFYRKIGHKGGNAPHLKPRGFAAMPREKVSEAGKKGGVVSRRNRTAQAR